MIDNEIEQIELKLAQAKAKKERLEAVANEKRRKRETRAKIMIGGTVLKMLDGHNEQVREMTISILESTLRSLGESDRQMFDKWLFETGKNTICGLKK